ncbi:MAG: SDR family oxidoreductase [Phototrophicaceae bacterium]
MNGKVVIVTGGTNGIGEVTALELARQGARVVVISRNETKLQNTVKMIQSETGNDNVTYIQADLSSIDDINRAADMFLQKHDRLDVLVNNAGSYFSDRLESVDGHEMTLALNHLNYFLLTERLLETLKTTAAQYGEARIVNVSSMAHNSAKINFDDIQAHQYSGFRRYGETKLMNVMFTYALDRRLQGSNVTVNALHPGFVNTGFGMNNDGILTKFLGLIQKLIAISPEKGAETNIYLASSPDVKGISGKYWDNKSQKQSNAASHDDAQQEKLWAISEELVTSAMPESV